MRKIPDSPSGSEQWQDGWATGYEQCLIDAEGDQDAPRTWTRPDAPADVNRVLGEDTGQIWTRKDARARTRSCWSNGNYSLSWVELLDHEKVLTAVVETELEGAARRLRDAGYSHSVAAEEDIRIVLDHVLGGGTL